MGGSVARAVRRRGLARRIVGVEGSSEGLRRARSADVVDEVSTDLRRAAGAADMILFAVPVDRLASTILLAATACGPGTLLTDIGSTKAAIVQEVETRLPEGRAFVGGHPLAGSEKQGPEHADARLFEGRLIIVTKTERTDAGALARTAEFWQALGGRVRVMDPLEHDQAVAWTSHLPHVAAAALAQVLPTDLAALASAGIRDTTRVASGDPELWAAILYQNREAIVGPLRRFREQLAWWEQCLGRGDRGALGDLLAEAKRARDALGG